MISGRVIAALSASQLIGWGVTGVGILALAASFLYLSRLRPELDGGIYSYARAGFGDLVGFFSAWGYWLCATIGVVGYLVLLPAQAFSLSMYALMQLVLAAQVNARLLRIAPWQLELLVYGYQVGSLVVPTLAPILVWLWLDRQFVAKVVVPAWKPLAPPSAADPS